jgi:hypothetical protein
VVDGKEGPGPEEAIHEPLVEFGAVLRCGKVTGNPPLEDRRQVAGRLNAGDGCAERDGLVPASDHEATETEFHSVEPAA